jgi:hypothetical protein
VLLLVQHGGGTRTAIIDEKLMKVQVRLALPQEVFAKTISL